MSVPPLAFLDAVAGYTRAQSSSSADRPIKLAKIDPAYDPFAAPYPQPVPAARVTFEGEDTLSTKEYVVANGFLPEASQRVYMVPIGTTYLIAGAVNPQTPQGFWQDADGSDYGVEFGGGSYWDNSSGLVLETDAEIQGDLAVGGIGKTIDVVKPSNTSRANNTIINDPHLTVNLDIGTWYIDIDLIFGATTGDFRTAWLVSGTTVDYSLKTCWGSSPFTVDTATPLEARGRDATPMRVGVHQYNTAVAYGANSTTLYYGAREWGVVKLSTAGSVTLQWAQETTDATASLLVAGSMIRARRIA